MKTAFALAALAGSVAALGAAPADCSPNYSGEFEITIVKPSNLANRDLSKRQATTCGQTGILTLLINNGDLMDIDGRTGYIASNNSQFQFDKPVQAGGEYEGEFSICKNGSIALGPTTNFYQCQSGSFYNLYYSNVADQCSLVNIDIIPCSNSSSSSSAASTATTAAAISVSSDGQPQATVTATSAVPVSMFTDGQPQATVPATAAAIPVSEYTDGQPQATVAATAKSNVTAATATPKATIVTAGASQMTTSFFFAGAMAVLALF